MNARLQSLFDLLENDRRTFVARIANISDQQFNYAPAGKWSINQILSHLITAEKLTLQYMQKKSLGIADLKDSTYIEDLKMMMLKASQRLPFKFKAPPLVERLTRGYSDRNTLVLDWEKERRALADFLDQIGDNHIKRKIYRHVFAGLMNVQHALAFNREHFRHHLPQLDKLLK